MQPAMQILNTHQLIKDFQELGFKEKQAEGIVNFVVRSKEFDISRLATKEQLAMVEERLKAEFKTEINDVKAEIKILDAKIGNVEKNLREVIAAAVKESTITILKWIIPTTFTVVISFIGLVIKAFFIQ